MRGVLVVLALAGCAASPLAPEDEIEIAKRCTEGCVVVPQSVWERIVELLHGERI